MRRGSPRNPKDSYVPELGGETEDHEERRRKGGVCKPLQIAGRGLRGPSPGRNSYVRTCFARRARTETYRSTNGNSQKPCRHDRTARCRGVPGRPLLNIAHVFFGSHGYTSDRHPGPGMPFLRAERNKARRVPTIRTGRANKQGGPSGQDNFADAEGGEKNRHSCYCARARGSGQYLYGLCCTRACKRKPYRAEALGPEIARLAKIRTSSISRVEL